MTLATLLTIGQRSSSSKAKVRAAVNSGKDVLEQDMDAENRPEAVASKGRLALIMLTLMNLKQHVDLLTIVELVTVLDEIHRTTQPV